MPLELHPATPPDAPAIATLFFTTFSDPFNVKLFPRTQDVHAWWTNALTKDIRNPRKRLLKVIDTDADSAIVGFALWSLPMEGTVETEAVEDGFSPPWPESCDGKFYVIILGTHPDARRKGVATKLMEWGLEKAKEDGVEVYLSATQMGKPVYEKLGFEDRGRVEAVGHVQYSMVWSP
ncbi:hypothetical protein BBP40_001490 [Aspergillus hancockii]|nr:hypothetical protein BBP40_001490 [Aspergillus hancockii]